MLYRNARIFTPDRGFIFGSFRVEGGCFSAITEGDAPEEGEDLRGALVLPGLVDIHIHGCAGADFSDALPESLPIMGAALVRHGITSFAATAMSLSEEALLRCAAAARVYRDANLPGCSRLLAMRAEGPYLSPMKKGSHNEEYLRLPDIDAFRRIYEASDGLLRITDMAAELPGAAEFAENVSGFCTVSLGHSAADYNIASRFFGRGARHVTHLYNAMSPLLHRAPGVIGAALERDEVTAELIADGIHVHPAAVLAAFRLFPDRLCLVSDALRCCTLPEGEYELGGQTVVYRGGAAYLPDGKLAGAGRDLFTDLVNAIRFGVPAEEAVRAASSLPARVIGCEKEVGSIAVGRKADFLVCSPEWTLERVLMDGKEVEMG